MESRKEKRKRIQEETSMERRVTRATTAAAAAQNPLEMPQRKPLTRSCRNSNIHGIHVQSKKSNTNKIKNLSNKKNKEKHEFGQGKKKLVMKRQQKRGRKAAKLVKNVKEAVKNKEICPLTEEKVTKNNKTSKEDDKIFKKPKIPLLPRSKAKSKSAEQSNNLSEKWYVIKLRTWPTEPRAQGQYLEVPLITLANAATTMTLPSAKWHRKFKLKKVQQHHTMTTFTGDLKQYKIDEKDRHKYQPDCVIFRRDALLMPPHILCTPYDRVLIFKDTCFTIAIDGKIVHLNGAPDAITSLKEVHILLDILDSISFSNPMVEIVMSISPKDYDF
ncbi:GH11374 [Drosophila grimshawi]|uniref:GH11374 n=1 Tax=Drosophila grimshawi TaxID=7222 RepID=B4JEH2_DROGR|nr:GH11374 [Drosophila grimshawi]